MEKKPEYLERTFLGSDAFKNPIAKDVLPQDGMDPDVAKTIVEHIRLNEAKADQNFATFCTTEMEKQADELMLEGLNTNAIDKSEYPRTAAMEN